MFNLKDLLEGIAMQHLFIMQLFERYYGDLSNPFFNLIYHTVPQLLDIGGATIGKRVDCAVSMSTALSSVW